MFDKLIDDYRRLTYVPPSWIIRDKHDFGRGPIWFHLDEAGTLSVRYQEADRVLFHALGEVQSATLVTDTRKVAREYLVQPWVLVTFRDGGRLRVRVTTTYRAPSHFAVGVHYLPPSGPEQYVGRWLNFVVGPV